MRGSAPEILQGCMVVLMSFAHLPNAFREDGIDEGSPCPRTVTKFEACKWEKWYAFENLPCVKITPKYVCTGGLCSPLHDL